MTDHERDEERRADLWDNLGDAFEALWRGLRRLVDEGNRRQLAVRNRKGEILVRLPLTIAVLIGLFLLWRAVLILILLAILAFVFKGSLVILRRENSDH